jgi:hypothetical protein
VQDFILEQIIQDYFFTQQHIWLNVQRGILRTHILMKYPKSKMTITHILKNNPITDAIRQHPINNHICHHVRVI